MKTNLILLSFAFCVVSCDTETIMDESRLQTTDYIGKSASSSYRVIYCIERSLSNPEDMYMCNCAGTGGNCLPEVVIEGAISQIFDDFLTAIEEEQLPQFFGNSENWQQIFPELSQHPSKLEAISNNLLKFTKLQTEEEDLHFFALHESHQGIDGGNVAERALLVFPVRKE